MWAAIFNNRLNTFADERKPCRLEGRTLPISIEAAPKLRRTEPIFIVVKLLIPHAEVRKQDAAAAEPPRN